MSMKNESFQKMSSSRLQTPHNQFVSIVFRNQTTENTKTYAKAEYPEPALAPDTGAALLPAARGGFFTSPST